MAAVVVVVFETARIAARVAAEYGVDRNATVRTGGYSMTATSIPSREVPLIIPAILTFSIPSAIPPTIAALQWAATDLNSTREFFLRSRIPPARTTESAPALPRAT